MSHILQVIDLEEQQLVMICMCCGAEGVGPIPLDEDDDVDIYVAHLPTCQWARAESKGLPN